MAAPEPERLPFRAAVHSVEGVPTLDIYTFERGEPVNYSIPIPDLKRHTRTGALDPMPRTHEVDVSLYFFSFDIGVAQHPEDGSSRQPDFRRRRGIIKLILEGFNGPVADRMRVLEIKTRIGLESNIKIRRHIVGAAERQLWNVFDILYVESVRQQLVEREKPALREMLGPAQNLMKTRRLLGNLRKPRNTETGANWYYGPSNPVPEELAVESGPGNILAEMLTGIPKKSAKQQAAILKEKIAIERSKYSLESLRVTDEIRNEAIQMFPRLTGRERNDLYGRVIRNWATAPLLRNPDGMVGRTFAIFLTQDYTPENPANLQDVLIGLIVNDDILDVVYPLYRIIHVEMLEMGKRPKPGDATTQPTAPDFLAELEERTLREQPRWGPFWNSQYRIVAGLAPATVGGGPRRRRRTRRFRRRQG